jgi:hypothetical protein
MPYKELKMMRFARRTAIVGALVVGGFLAVFFGFLNHNRNLVACTGCGLPRPVLVATVSIPKGTSGRAIGTNVLYSTKYLPSGVRWPNGALIDPSEVRGEVTAQTISVGARLTAADFALRGPIYYPHGYPKTVPASQTPAKMSHYLGPPSFTSDLAVAPGVWVDGSPSQAAIDEHVANGTLVGYCRSVRAFQAHNPEIAFATKCWRT